MRHVTTTWPEIRYNVICKSARMRLCCEETASATSWRMPFIHFILILFSKPIFCFYSFGRARPEKCRNIAWVVTIESGSIGAYRAIGGAWRTRTEKWRTMKRNEKCVGGNGRNPLQPPAIFDSDKRRKKNSHMLSIRSIHFQAIRCHSSVYFVSITCCLVTHGWNDSGVRGAIQLSTPMTHFYCYPSSTAHARKHRIKTNHNWSIGMVRETHGGICGNRLTMPFTNIYIF